MDGLERHDLGPVRVRAPEDLPEVVLSRVGVVLAHLFFVVLSVNFLSLTGSLCLKTCLGTPLFLMPCIMEAWFPESE